MLARIQSFVNNVTIITGTFLDSFQDQLVYIFDGSYTIVKGMVDGTGDVATSGAAPALAAGEWRANILRAVTSLISNGALTVTSGGATITGNSGVTGTFTATSNISSSVGNVSANLALVAGTTVTAGTGLTVTSGTSSFGGPIAATASAWEIADPGNGGAIPVTASGVVNLACGAGAETRTIAIPTFNGQSMLIHMSTNGGGAITLTASQAINGVGDTNMVFASVRDMVKLEGVEVGGALRWSVTASYDVVFS